MTLAPKWAATGCLPFVTDPCLPIRRLLNLTIRTISATNSRTHTDCHTLSRSRLLIMKKGTIFSIRATLFSVKLLAMPTFVRPLRLNPQICGTNSRYLVFFPLLNCNISLLLMSSHNVLPIRGRFP